MLSNRFHLFSHFSRFSLALAAPLLSVALVTAHAQTATNAVPAASTPSYPNKTIRWIVSYPAGGGSDFLARTLSVPLGQQLGQSIVVDNRPGAASIIGTDLAAKAPADGYTLVSGDNGALVFNPALYKKLPYAVSDLAPVGLMARFPLVLVVNAQVKAANAQELFKQIKAEPGKFSFASPGAGSPHHLAMELIKDRAGLFAVHVPYRGAAPAVQDVIGGQLPMMMIDTAVGLPQIRAGKLRPLAVASNRRLPQLPDVPTLQELGFKDIEVYAWQGLLVPKDTPAPVIAALSGGLLKSLAQPDVKKTLLDFGLEIIASDPATFKATIDSETRFWRSLIEIRGLKLE